MPNESPIRQKASFIRLRQDFLYEKSYLYPRKLCLWEGILVLRCPSIRAHEKTLVEYTWNSIKAHNK